MLLEDFKLIRWFFFKIRFEFLLRNFSKQALFSVAEAPSCNSVEGCPTPPSKLSANPARATG
jgi:hypothetical protein